MANRPTLIRPAPAIILVPIASVLALATLAGCARRAPGPARNVVVAAASAGPADEGRPAQRPRRHDTEDLIAAIDRAFAARPNDLKPAVLVFPALDARDRVRPEGTAIGNMALFASTYTPHKRLTTCIPYFQEVLTDAQCARPGALIDRASIDLCSRAAETALYVIPRVDTRDDASYRLTVAFHGDGKTYRDRTFQHPLPPDQLRRAPGLIARDVLEQVGVRLSPGELEDLVRPRVETDDDLQTLNAFWWRTTHFGDRDATIKDFLRRNPRCVQAWEMYLNHARDAEQALAEFGRLRPPLECDRLKITRAIRLREMGRAEEALLGLLKLAPSHRGDAWYHWTLTRCAAELEDERLTEHLLEVWQREEPGYTGCLMRGRVLIEWAWQARGDGWAFTVTPQGWRLFDARLKRARAELEQAVQLNPDGWVAHSSLLTVAMGLGLPRAYLEEHFRKAVALRPRYAGAYRARLLDLKPRWHGTPAELLAFGRRCLKTGFWEDGIPQLMLEVVEDFCLDPDSGATLFTSFRAPELWDAVQDYYREAMKHGRPEDRNKALNYLAKWGVCGEHYDDVAVAFQKLAGTERLDEGVWNDLNLYLFFRDLVHAATGKLPVGLSGYTSDRALAIAGVALAYGDVDLAEKEMARVRKDSGDVSADTLIGYQRAIELGRRLRAEKQLVLGPRQVQGVFVGIQRNWSVQGDRLVCDLAVGARTEIHFPLGIQHGVITGTLEWSKGMANVQVQAHIRALRDPVTIVYLPDSSTVQVVRNGQWIAQDPYPPGPQRFRLEFRADRDRLEPCAGLGHETVVSDDVPSGFGFVATAGDQPATFAISDLRIELQE